MLKFVSPQIVLAQATAGLEHVLPELTDPAARRQVRAAVFLTRAVAHALAERPHLLKVDHNAVTDQETGARVDAIVELTRWISVQPLPDDQDRPYPLGVLNL